MSLEKFTGSPEVKCLSDIAAFDEEANGFRTWLKWSTTGQLQNGTNGAQSGRGDGVSRRFVDASGARHFTDISNPSLIS
jgi:hypothetical protein